MKVSLYKKKGITIAHIWFAQSLDKVLSYNADVIFVHNYEGKQMKIGTIEKQQTLVSKNYVSSCLLEKYSKTLKYEIVRSKKDCVKYSIMYNNDISNEELMQFKKVYDEMYASKGLKTKLCMNLVNSYINNEMFILSKAYLNEETFVYHAFVYDDNNVRLLYSCSNFRNCKNKSFIGRCNKYLHYMELEYYENKNIIYDWGGISDFASPNGIDKFKMEFLGEKKEYYNYIIGKSFLGKIIEIMYRMKR